VGDEEGDGLPEEQAIDLEDITCLDILLALEAYGVRASV